jgi:hypothetical protein
MSSSIAVVNCVFPVNVFDLGSPNLTPDCFARFDFWLKGTKREVEVMKPVMKRAGAEEPGYESGRLLHRGACEDESAESRSIVGSFQRFSQHARPLPV